MVSGAIHIAHQEETDILFHGFWRSDLSHAKYVFATFQQIICTFFSLDPDISVGN
jgi:hypothetical protein